MAGAVLVHESGLQGGLRDPGEEAYGFTHPAGGDLASAVIDASPIIATAATPVPAALPLFASGLGALGLFGWRRKRKAALAA
jgi:hypothetical protein